MANARSISVIWEYFNKIDPAKCVICTSVVNIKGSNTSSMRKHLERLHREDFALLVDKENVVKSKKAKTAAQKKLDSRQMNIDRFAVAVGLDRQSLKMWGMKDSRTTATNHQLIEMVARDSQPLSIVDRDGFIRFVGHLQPCYPLPSRTTLTAMIEPECERIRGLIILEMEGASFISFTSDIWSDSVTNQSYISLSDA